MITRTVETTKDYTIFNTLQGNRDVDSRHVAELVRLFKRNGNRTLEFPIVVDEQMNVIDGQHRLAALRELEWEVAYTVVENANIALVRTINNGSKRWDWKDLAASYARLGNEEYGWFLAFALEFNLPFTVAFAIARNNATGKSNRQFTDGDLKIQNKPAAMNYARQYVEIRELLNDSTRDVALGWFTTARSEVYDHQRMMKKLAEVKAFPAQANIPDYARAFEEVYNRGYSDRTRLF